MDIDRFIELAKEYGLELKVTKTEPGKGGIYSNGKQLTFEDIFPDLVTKLNDDDIIFKDHIMKESVDMNREDAKSIITQFIKCQDYCNMGESDICIDCKDNYDPYKFMIACKKVIIEMDKIDKIEKLINNMISEARGEKYHNEGYEAILLQLKTLGKIEQILEVK